MYEKRIRTFKTLWLRPHNYFGTDFGSVKGNRVYFMVLVVGIESDLVDMLVFHCCFFGYINWWSNRQRKVVTFRPYSTTTIPCVPKTLIYKDGVSK